MKYPELCDKFSQVESFEDFEKLRADKDLFIKAAQEIIHRHQLPQVDLKLFPEGTNVVFALGDDRVVKIFPPMHAAQYQSEVAVLRHLYGKLSVQTPQVEHSGEIAGWPYLVMTKLPGTLLETLWHKIDHQNKLILVRELGALIYEVHQLDTSGLEAIDVHWEEFIQKQMQNCVDHHKARHLPAALVANIPEYLESVKATLVQIQKPVILTGEYTPMNILVREQNGTWHITGLIDFGDAMLGRAEYDLLGPVAFLIEGDKELLTAFLTAYGIPQEQLTLSFSQKMMALMLLHQHSNLNMQVRIADWQNKVATLQDLENLVWNGMATMSQSHNGL